MSTARGHEVIRQRWIVPGVCVVFAAAFLGVFLATGHVALAISSAVIMLAYGAVLVLFSRRSEVAAVLREDAVDERRASINVRAASMTLQIVVSVAVIMTFVQLAGNHGAGTWGTVCGISGASYIACVVLYSRRG